jgi:hypothetical protein
MMARLKLNEIKSIIKMGHFNKGRGFEKVAQKVFGVETFCNGIGKILYKNLMKSPNMIVISSVKVMPQF